MNIKIMIPVVLLSSLSLISCGGGSDGGSAGPTGYTGTTTQASVTTANKNSLAISATAGAGQAVAENAAQDAVFRPAPVTAFVLGFSNQVYTHLTTANRTANQLVDGVCLPGTVDVTSNQDGSLITLIFSNCTVIGGNGESVNGTVFVTSDPQNIDNFTMRFVNVSVLYLGESYSINMTIACNSLGCTWSSDFAGPDGRIYRTENAVVSSFGANSFNVNATVYDPDNGSIAISGTVTYGSCAGGVPASGSITFTGASATSGSVVFNSCDSFTVTVEGVPTVYFWADFLP